MFAAIATAYSNTMLIGLQHQLADSLHRCIRKDWCAHMQPVWKQNLETLNAELAARNLQPRFLQSAYTI